ncbi:phosphoethanolamine--lipid A transferase [Moraxella nasovis]|uniref:phosphoethanolamine transferase n=1 Tax=Moraxella nasovis TaxID=2904121 RepID=UPI001F60B76F|nr:phosphoethanolamine--lipid A transferase [Moraxella nasovis]UNU74025.1 phosphoethanolamine--lipid A transferase [Moraxella nasovis]
MRYTLNRQSYRRFRPKMYSIWLFGLVSLYFSLLNFPFYQKVFNIAHHEGSAGAFLFSLPVFIFGLLWAIFSVIGLPIIHKIIIPILLTISAAISYQSLFFGVYFDYDMLTNVLQTTPAESSRLITLPYLAWIVIFGIVPSVLYLKTKIIYRPIIKEIAFRLLAICIGIGLTGLIAALFYQDYASFFRNHRETKNLIVPSNFIATGVKHYKIRRNANRPFETIGLDAKLQKTDDLRNVTVLVVGETTRAANWGLSGYARQTTPKLAARDDVINFKNTISCGTSTAYSVPCMFSHLPKDSFNIGDAPFTDNLMDIMQRAGIYANWQDNDSGCKDVCNRIPNDNVTALNIDGLCHDGECQDEILFHNLDDIMGRTDKDTVIVLHTIGSHGPTYFERYPKEFNKFTPTCKTSKINTCNNEELVNTYDNTILYVDYILDKAINYLQAQDGIKSSLIYVSDHGESLGENGIYLHGTPYAVAPEHQTHVPMIFWANDAFYQSKRIDKHCLKTISDEQHFSHDNFYHTVIGMSDMDKSFSLYDKKLDIIAMCQK